MILNSQNKSNSESNVSKNKLPCRSNSSNSRVDLLIQKYERLSSENIHSQECYNLQKDKYEQCSEMEYPVLNKNHVRTFLGVGDNSSDNSDKMFKKSTVKTKSSKEKSPSIPKRRDDLFSRLFSSEEKRDKNSSTLPIRKKTESKSKNVARSVSASSKDKKFKYLSPNRDNTTQDGGFVQSKLSVFSTGTVPKQNDTYRKRRESYVIATQQTCTPETHRKTIEQHTEQLQTKEDKTVEEKIPRRYVEKTISKFENDCFTLPKKKIEQSINSLFQQYHDKKMGTSDKMTREELNLEIDNVLLNNFKQISRDSSPEEGKPNHLQPQYETNAQNWQQNTDELYNGEEEIKTNIVVESTNEESSDVMKTNLYLEIDDNSENFKVSIENLCEDLEKVINENICAGSKIEGIYVSIENVNMIENTDTNQEIIYENLNYIQDKIVEHTEEVSVQNEDNQKFEQILRVNDDMEFEVQDMENRSSKKVSSLVSYFSGIISESRSRSRFSSVSTIKNEDVETSSETDYEEIEDNCINTPEINISECSTQFSFEDTEEETVKNEDVQEKNLLQNDLSISKTKSFNEQKRRPKSDNFVRSSSFKDESKRYSFLNYVHTQNELLKDEDNEKESEENSIKEIEKRNSFLHRNNSDSTPESKPRFSRLYSGKFKRNTTTKQDTNNNEELNKEEKLVFDKILNDTDFLSDSEGDYDHAETINPKFENESTNFEDSEPIDRYIKVDEQFQKENIYEEINFEEDPECVYENLKRFRSTDTVQVMYDEHERAIIRMSMVNLSDDSLFDMSEEMKIQESEKEIMKTIEEIKDPLPTKKACLINELITTEKSYINNSLHRLVHDYMPEMDREEIPKGLLGKSRQIFGNADLLYEGHKEYVLPALENYSTVEDIGLAFLNNENIFKYYPLYSKNKPKSDIVMKDHSSYFEEKQKDLNDKLDLASFLLTPIQRLAKYCQLVGSLVKECEKEQIECKKIRAAWEMLSKQMRMGNDLIALDAIEGFNGSILDLGELLLRDAFTMQPPNKKPAFDGMIFLFQRCLMITVICRQGFKETYIYKESFQLTDLGYSDYAPLEFSVWFRKRDVNMYKFITKSQQLKEKWTKEIFNLLWQQLEANKKRRKKELEDNGVQDTRIPLDPKRPFSVPNKNTESSTSTKVRRKKTMNSSTETVWYTSDR